MGTALKNVLVIGGSYVGVSAAQQIAALLPATHKVLLIEPHSHFHHLFAFPRFAVVPSYEHKAFIPYTGVFDQENIPNPSSHSVVRAKVLAVRPNEVLLDREWQGATTIPFDYVTIATGTRLPAPGSMQSDEKKPSISYFQSYQDRVKKASSIVIVGGGAVGVQMATDLKELYPSKEVILVHSREKVMPKFHPLFHDLIEARLKELGVKLVTNSRIIFPAEGYPEDGSTFTVDLKDGSTIETQLVIPATGQLANNQLVRDLPTSSNDSIINPENGFIRVLPTLQFKDPLYPNLFAVGDIADTGAHKAARPGAGQAGVVAKNIRALIEGKQASDVIEVGPAGIHMSLGIKQNIVFRNPAPGETGPWYKWRDDGSEDMHIEGVWARRGVKVNGPEDYHL